MDKRLYRSRRDKIIGGVAGGIGQYFDIDPLIVRILFVVGALVGGWGVVAYIVCWIVIPQEPASAAESAPAPQPTEAPAVQPPPRTRRRVVFGTALIGIGALFLLDNLLPGFCVRDFWPALLILLGAAILLRRGS